MLLRGKSVTSEGQKEQEGEKRQRTIKRMLFLKVNIGKNESEYKQGPRVGLIFTCCSGFHVFSFHADHHGVVCFSTTDYYSGLQ